MDGTPSYSVSEYKIKYVSHSSNGSGIWYSKVWYWYCGDGSDATRSHHEEHHPSEWI